MTNPIIEEVRAARASIAAEHGYDRTKILAWARAKQASLKMKNPNSKGCREVSAVAVTSSARATGV